MAYFSASCVKLKRNMVILPGTMPLYKQTHHIIFLYCPIHTAHAFAIHAIKRIPLV